MNSEPITVAITVNDSADASVGGQCDVLKEAQDEPWKGGAPRLTHGARDKAAVLENPAGGLYLPAYDGGALRMCDSRGLALPRHYP